MQKSLVASVLVVSLAAVTFVAAAAHATSRHATGLQHNPCAFLAPTTAGHVATTATFLKRVIGTYPDPRPVTIVPGAEGETGPDFQDGICDVSGGLGWYSGVTKPCVPPAAGKTCSPAYILLGVVTAPLADATTQMNAFGVGAYTVHTDLPGTGGHGKLVCRPSSIGSRCGAWFTKGTKFVYIYNQNIELPAAGLMKTAAEAIYAHTTLWSSEKPPRGA